MNHPLLQCRVLQTCGCFVVPLLLVLLCRCGLVSEGQGLKDEHDGNTKKHKVETYLTGQNPPRMPSDDSVYIMGSVVIRWWLSAWMGVGLRHLRESLVCRCEWGSGGKGWGWRLTFPCKRENMGTRILNLSACQQRGEKKVNQLTSTRRDGYLQGVGGGQSKSLSSILTFAIGARNGGRQRGGFTWPWLRLYKLVAVLWWRWHEHKGLVVIIIVITSAAWRRWHLHLEGVNDSECVTWDWQLNEVTVSTCASMRPSTHKRHIVR